MKLENEMMYEENSLISCNGKQYEVIKLLGHGKGGYSYLVQLDGKQYCLKKIHHEPCDYYQFGDKLQSEINDYNRLKDIVLMPVMYEYDRENEIVLKEYIDGELVSDLVQQDKLESKYLDQVIAIAEKCKEHGLNIDYYPTNFIVSNDRLYYIDYECNEYMEQWDYDNWGAQYWK